MDSNVQFGEYVFFNERTVICDNARTYFYKYILTFERILVEHIIQNDRLTATIINTTFIDSCLNYDQYKMCL